MMFIIQMSRLSRSMSQCILNVLVTINHRVYVVQGLSWELPHRSKVYMVLNIVMIILNYILLVVVLSQLPIQRLLKMKLVLNLLLLLFSF